MVPNRNVAWSAEMRRSQTKGVWVTAISFYLSWVFLGSNSLFTHREIDIYQFFISFKKNAGSAGDNSGNLSANDGEVTGKLMAQTFSWAKELGALFCNGDEGGRDGVSGWQGPWQRTHPCPPPWTFQRWQPWSRFCPGYDLLRLNLGSVT